jgi:hypothetical protein
MQTPPSDPLDPIFVRARSAAPPRISSVAPEVWQRIHATQVVGRRTGWWARLEAAFAQPSFAVAFVTACMLFGLFLAEMRLSRLQADRNAQLARSYVRLVAPLLENPPPLGRATTLHP